jgi:glucose dehydrogenase
MTRIAVLLALAGVALLVTGLVLIFGSWAMVAAGVALLAAGLVPDWERGA